MRILKIALPVLALVAMFAFAGYEQTKAEDLEECLINGCTPACGENQACVPAWPSGCECEESPCGDGLCNPAIGEGPDTCPADCPSCSSCTSGGGTCPDYCAGMDCGDCSVVVCPGQFSPCMCANNCPFPNHCEMNQCILWNGGTNCEEDPELCGL